MLNEDDLDEEEIAQNNSVDMNMMKALIGLDINDTEADAAKDLNDSIKLHNILSRNNPVYNLNNPSSKVTVFKFDSFKYYLLSNCFFC